MEKKKCEREGGRKKNEKRNKRGQGRSEKKEVK